MRGIRLPKAAETWMNCLPTTANSRLLIRLCAPSMIPSLASRLAWQVGSIVAL